MAPMTEKAEPAAQVATPEMVMPFGDSSYPLAKPKPKPKPPLRKAVSLPEGPERVAKTVEKAQQQEANAEFVSCYRTSGTLSVPSRKLSVGGGVIPPLPGAAVVSASDVQDELRRAFRRGLGATRAVARFKKPIKANDKQIQKGEDSKGKDKEPGGDETTPKPQDNVTTDSAGVTSAEDMGKKGSDAQQNSASQQKTVDGRCQKDDGINETKKGKGPEEKAVKKKPLKRQQKQTVGDNAENLDLETAQATLKNVETKQGSAENNITAKKSNKFEKQESSIQPGQIRPVATSRCLDQINAKVKPQHQVGFQQSMNHADTVKLQSFNEPTPSIVHENAVSLAINLDNQKPLVEDKTPVKIDALAFPNYRPQVEEANAVSTVTKQNTQTEPNLTDQGNFRNTNKLSRQPFSESKAKETDKSVVSSRRSLTEEQPAPCESRLTIASSDSRTGGNTGDADISLKGAEVVTRDQTETTTKLDLSNCNETQTCLVQKSSLSIDYTDEEMDRHVHQIRPNESVATKPPDAKHHPTNSLDHKGQGSLPNMTDSNDQVTYERDSFQGPTPAILEEATEVERMPSPETSKSAQVFARRKSSIASDTAKSTLPRVEEEEIAGEKLNLGKPQRKHLQTKGKKEELTCVKGQACEGIEGAKFQSAIGANEIEQLSGAELHTKARSDTHSVSGLTTKIADQSNGTCIQDKLRDELHAATKQKGEKKSEAVTPAHDLAADRQAGGGKAASPPRSVGSDEETKLPSAGQDKAMTSSMSSFDDRARTSGVKGQDSSSPAASTTPQSPGHANVQAKSPSLNPSFSASEDDSTAKTLAASLKAKPVDNAATTAKSLMGSGKNCSRPDIPGLSRRMTLSGPATEMDLEDSEGMQSDRSAVSWESLSDIPRLPSTSSLSKAAMLTVATAEAGNRMSHGTKPVIHLCLPQDGDDDLQDVIRNERAVGGPQRRQSAPVVSAALAAAARRGRYGQRQQLSSLLAHDGDDGDDGDNGSAVDDLSKRLREDYAWVPSRRKRDRHTCSGHESCHCYLFSLDSVGFYALS